MEEVDENDGSDLYYCLRCGKEYCTICNPHQKVDFDVVEHEEEDGTGDIVNRKGSRVCPYCYNQLVDKVNKTEKH